MTAYPPNPCEHCGADVRDPCTCVEDAIEQEEHDKMIEAGASGVAGAVRFPFHGWGQVLSAEERAERVKWAKTIAPDAPWPMFDYAQAVLDRAAAEAGRDAARASADDLVEEVLRLEAERDAALARVERLRDALGAITEADYAGAAGAAAFNWAADRANRALAEDDARGGGA